MVDLFNDGFYLEDDEQFIEYQPTTNSNKQIMKTIDLISKLKAGDRARVLNNSTSEDLEIERPNLAEAVALAFVWSKSPEGYTYWSDLTHDLIMGEYTFTEEESKERESPLPTDAAEAQRRIPIYLGIHQLLPQRHRCRVSLELQRQPTASPRPAPSLGQKQVLGRARRPYASHDRR